MKEIAVEYRWLFLNRKLIRSIPERWEELDAKQLTAVAKIALGKITDDEYLHEFGNIPLKVIKRLDTYQKYRIGKLLAFTEGFEPWYKFILKLPGLSAPRPRLEAMTFGQFMFVDTYYGDWIGFDSAQPDADREENLNKFIGSLYLPEKESFDTEKTDIYIENAKQLQEAEKIAITLNYRLLKEWLSNLYPMIFPRPDETEEKKDKKALPSTNGWLQIFESIVGEDLIHQEEYFNLGVHSVLRHLTKKMKENAKR